MKHNKNNQGQIAIIVLLASAVLLTLGLSASKKTIIDTKVNTDEELLKEAFNTAESGINNYLNSGVSSYSTGEGNAVVSSLDIGNANSLSSEGIVVANTPQLFWLVDHAADGKVSTTYYTGSNIGLSVDSGFIGALKIDYFYIEGGVYKSQRFGCRYDGGSNAIFDNGFTSTCSSLTLPGSRLLIVVTPLGGSTKITISGSSAFPKQGDELTSVGTMNSGVKTQIKTRNVYQIPAFFTESITAKNEVK